MEKQKQFMKEAIRLSMENAKNGKGGPFGTVIVKNGNIISSGVNKVTQSSDPTAHAEIVAIRSACEKLGTYQLDAREIYCSCEPCPMCLGAIYWARPDRIYYANTRKDAANINFDDNFIYNELDVSISQRKLPTTQLLRDEAQAAFTQWRESTDKIEY